MAAFGEKDPSEYLSAAAADPNLAGVTTVDELHAKLKKLSLALSEKDGPDSPFKKIEFAGTNPNPTFEPNAYKANKGVDGSMISTYYRYAVKDEAVAAKAVGIKAPTAPSGGGGGGVGVAPPKLLKAAVPAPAPAPKAAARFGSTKLSVKDLIAAVKARDPAVTTADFSGQATFQMNPDAKITELVAALGDDNGSPVTSLVFKNCGLMDSTAAILGAFLAKNTTIKHIDMSENKAVKDAGAVALAAGLSTNTGLLEINLMGLGGSVAVKSEAICTAFITCFQTNLTLKKPIWRLDHPLAHTLARLVTRNTSIARHVAQGKEFESLLPDALRGTGVIVAGAKSTGA